MRPIRVLAIDDSALMRALLVELLSRDSDIEVVGTAPDPLVAREKIKQLDPHVLTLDVEMPRMDGFTFLENLMRLRPMPVVMVSSLTQKGADATLQALELGAFDFVAKPKLGVEEGMRAYADDLIAKIKMAARSPVNRTRSRTAGKPRLVTPVAHRLRTTDRIIAIGASTGGTEAIRDVLERMPPDAPGIVVTQHIPPAFSKPFAERLNRASAMQVCEATEGVMVRPGHVYVAPGDQHLRIVADGVRWYCRLDQGEPVNRHRPSVDVMFESVGRSAGANCVGVILTGMGEDGARGLLSLKNLGAPTIAQDESSCVVWGMPGAAVRLGAASKVLPLASIAQAILQCSGAVSKVT